MPDVGDIRVTIERCKQDECELCSEPATRQVTFLLEGARNNPKSSAYGKDDCSWCSDLEKSACEEHAEEIRKDVPEGYIEGGVADCRGWLRHLIRHWTKVEPEDLDVGDASKILSLLLIVKQRD